MEKICTVLLISYNHKDYIEKAINSVLEQKTKYNYIIHIFDDASNDGTAEIIKKYGDQYPDKIKTFIAQKNQGAQANIWAAYKSVDTKYCAILECDDFWQNENKLELQIDALEKHPECSFCAHNTSIININDKYRKNEDRKQLVTSKKIIYKNIFSFADIENLPHGFINHIASRIIRMEYVNLDKLKFKEAFLYDNCQFYYLLLKGPCYFINKTMNSYVQTGKGICSGSTPYKRIDMHIKALIDFNKETDYSIADKIYQEMTNYINYNIYLYRKSEWNLTKKLKVKFKQIKRYFIPRFILDLFDLPRDIIRLLKNIRIGG